MKHSSHYIYGVHAALAALASPARTIKRVLVTKNTQADIGSVLAGRRDVSVVDPKEIELKLPHGSVHQGIAIECLVLVQPSLQQWLAEKIEKPVVILDQVSDPHNVGAILRSAAAFDAGAVIVTDRNAPQESGVMAKAASGALETVPLISVVNLSQSLELLKKAGYWIYGLDGGAKESIAQAKFDAKTALVLGAEGKGMRRLTTEHCDFLVRLPMSGHMESLNVSNAAAVALYEVYRKLSS